DGCERVAVQRRGAVLAEGLEVVGGGIAFVTSETVLGVNGVPFFHAGITMRFGEDGSSSDGDAFAVALDERFLLNEDIQLDGVDEEVVGGNGELLKRGGHGLSASLVNVPGIDAPCGAFGNGPSERVLLCAVREDRAALFGKLFGVVQPDDAAFGIEDDGSRDDRAEQCAAAGFIDAGDASPAELAGRALETGGADAAHRGGF